MPVAKSLLNISLLKDMGIDVWQLRPPAGSRVEPAQPRETEVRSKDVENPPAAVLESPLATGQEIELQPRSAKHSADSASGPGSAAGASSAPGASSTPAAADTAAAVNDESAADESVIKPFRVFCFVRGDVMLMLQASHAREIGRFGRDLLVSACGDWRGQVAARAAHGGTQNVQETVFSWPPAGLAATEEDAVKGLCAFTDKQLSTGRRKKLIVLSRSIAQRLSGMKLPQSVVLLPPVAEMSGSWELKRNLWLELQTHTI